jgi:hypothetical protein
MPWSQSRAAHYHLLLTLLEALYGGNDEESHSIRTERRTSNYLLIEHK